MKTANINKPNHKIGEHHYKIEVRKVEKTPEIVFQAIKKHETQTKITKVMPIHKHVV